MKTIKQWLMSDILTENTDNWDALIVDKEDVYVTNFCNTEPKIDTNIPFSGESND